jgi:hypothetical protein
MSTLYGLVSRNSTGQNDRSTQIKKELVELFNAQTLFYRKGGASKHTQGEIAEFEKRRERVRALFAELKQAVAEQLLL